MEQQEKDIAGDQVKRFSLKVLIISIIFLASLFIFAVIAHEAVYENEKVVDDTIFAFFDSISTPGLLQVMKVFTFFGSQLFLLPAYIILVVYFLIKREFALCVHIGVIALSSTLLMFLLKQVFHRQRPQFPIIKGITSYSFPSGHALSAFIFCSILIFITINGKLKPFLKLIFVGLFSLFAIIIGLSRIFLKVHYPTDVIASFFLGLAWVTISLWLLKRINKMEL